MINNAGVNATDIPVAGMSTERWAKTIKTDLYGYFFCAVLSRFAKS